jgi:murein DD-endopeptidase MepM/ murein hydrolase activator NlpD
MRQPATTTTRRSQSVSARDSLLGQRSLFLYGLLGSLSLLSGGAVLSQTATDLVIPESSSAAVDTVPVSPVPLEIQPVPAPESFAPEAAPVIPEPPLSIIQTIPPVRAEAERYEAPSEIVFSERSTGCETVLAAGRSLSELCSAAAPERSTQLLSTVQGGIPAVRVAYLGSSPVVPTSTSLTPDLRNYYNRSLRPPARLGNGNIRLMFPLAIPSVISSAFGWRIHPITGNQRFHTGTDLAAPMGTPVLAAYAGQVAIADFLNGYGLTITLAHNQGTQETLYAHLSEIFVEPGELVKQGEVIGRVGSTGNSTGPHLHFEFRQLTPDGWVALDAGEQLEYALAQLVKAMQVAEAKQPKSKG